MIENIENNGDFIYEYTHKIITQVVSNQDKATLKAIERYCEEYNKRVGKYL